MSREIKELFCEGNRSISVIKKSVSGALDIEITRPVKDGDGAFLKSSPTTVIKGEKLITRFSLTPRAARALTEILKELDDYKG